MTRTIALLLGFLGTGAWAAEPDRMIIAVPQTEYPDILVIGNGWPANMTDGCLDRHECKPPAPGARVKVQAERSGGPLLSDIPTAPAGSKSGAH